MMISSILCIILLIYNIELWYKGPLVVYYVSYYILVVYYVYIDISSVLCIILLIYNIELWYKGPLLVRIILYISSILCIYRY